MDFNRLKNTYFILGGIFIFIFFLIGLSTGLKIIKLSWTTEPLVGAIFGFGGIILVSLGVIKAFLIKKG